MKKEWQLYSVLRVVWVTGSNMAKYVFMEMEHKVMCVVGKTGGYRSRKKNCASRNWRPWRGRQELSIYIYTHIYI